MSNWNVMTNFILKREESSRENNKNVLAGLAGDLNNKLNFSNWYVK